MGKPPLQAALDGAGEIGFTILSIVDLADRRVHPAADDERTGRQHVSRNLPLSSRSRSPCPPWCH